MFALHWSAFYLLLMIVYRLLPQGRGEPDVLSFLVLAAATVYLAPARRRVYGQSWPATGARTIGLFLLYQVLLALWMVSAMAVAFPLLL